MTHILIVDDDDQFRTMLRKVLQRAGYEVTEAANGEQGIDFFSENKADLVITDMLMPVMTGSRFISLLRQNFPKLKILAISGGGKMYHSDSYLDYARELGVKRILKKPVLRKEILQVVEDILG